MIRQNYKYQTNCLPVRMPGRYPRYRHLGICKEYVPRLSNRSPRICYLTSCVRSYIVRKPFSPHTGPFCPLYVSPRFLIASDDQPDYLFRKFRILCLRQIFLSSRIISFGHFSLPEAINELYFSFISFSDGWSGRTFSSIVCSVSIGRFLFHFRLLFLRFLYLRDRRFRL